MQKERNPPPLSAFTGVYLEAQGRLAKKLDTERELLFNLEDNLKDINEQLQLSTQQNVPPIRQFVFRALEMNGFNCDNPVFDISTEDGGNATVQFNDFQEGDIMIDLTPNHRQIFIVIIDNQTQKELVSISLNFTEYEDRRRKEKLEKAGPFEVFYEGQLIYNKTEYYQELNRLSQDRLELHREQKDELEQMKRSLDSLFPDAKLRALTPGTLHQSRDNFGSVLNIRESMSLEPRRPEFVTRISQRDIDRQNAFRPPEVNAAPNQIEKLSPFGRPPQPFDIESNRPQVLPIAWNVFVTYLLYINIVLLLCSLFVNWDRPDFIPLISSTIYVTWWYMKDDFETLIQAPVLVFIYGLGLAFDLLWLIKFSSDYWTFDIYLNDLSLKGVEKFIVVVSYILVVCEALALVVSIFLMIRGMEVGTSKKRPVDLMLY